MSEQTRAIYYPNLTLTIDVTRFGSKKLLRPSNPYERSLPSTVRGKKLLRIDLLEGLCDVWGENILMNRENIYLLVSGDTDDDRYRRLISKYYITHAAFANFVDLRVAFGRSSKPLYLRITDDTRVVLNEYKAHLKEELDKRTTAKYLLEDHEYLYVSVYDNCDVSDIRGVTVI